MPSVARAIFARRLPTIKRHFGGPRRRDGYYLYASGDCYRRLGEWDKAITDLTEAIHLNPKVAYYYWSRAYSYSKAGQHENAAADISQDIRLGSHDAKYCLEQGKLYCDTTQSVSPLEFDGIESCLEAFRYYDEAIRLEPNCASHHATRGRAYHRKALSVRATDPGADGSPRRVADPTRYGDLLKAIYDFSDAIRLAPSVAGYYSDRGAAYASLKDDPKAIDDFGRAIALNPEDAEFHKLRGQARERQGRNEMALRDFDELIRIRPNGESYAVRAELYSKMGEFARALSDYGNQIRVDPSAEFKPEFRLSVYRYGESFDRCLGASDEAIRKAPETCWYYVNRAAIYSEKKEYGTAARDLTVAVRLKPKEIELRHQLGRACQLSGNLANQFKRTRKQSGLIVRT